MLNVKLPKFVDPRKLADREIEISGVIAVKDMAELSPMLVHSDVDVFAELKFSRDHLRIRTILGSVKVTVPVQCQRCLEPVDVELEAALNLAISYSEEKAQTLPKYYDPLVVEGDDLELLPLIEQELILSLPIVSYHADCSIKTSFGDGSTVAIQETEKPNPFSVLAALKGSTDKK
ncbi:MAG: YceD family protein [Oceanospirillaceae bacterium]